LPVELLSADTLLSRIGFSYYSSYEGYKSELPYYIMIDDQKVCEGVTNKFIAYNSLIVPAGAHKVKVFIDSSLMFVLPVLNIKGMSNVFAITLEDRRGNGCDLDLMLVNSSGDTCSFRNPKPDWGVLNVTDDNPVHSGDELSFYSGDKEEIFIPNDSESAHTIIVRNFLDTNRVNSSYYGSTSKTALPSIKVVWGTMDTLMELDSLMENNVKVVNIYK